MTERTQARPLAGRRIALLETREADRLGQMLRDQGATIVSCRTVAAADVADPAPVRAWIERFVAEPTDYFVLLTGEGLLRLHALAEKSGVAAAFVTALARTTTITRGPKPARALRSLGIAPQLRAEQPTTEGVVSVLSRLELQGRRVGVQLYPDAPDRLCRYLEQAGARPDPVTPYAYIAGEPDEALMALIGRLVGREIDAIAFTSATQVRRLFEIAKQADEADHLATALRECAVAAIGPVVASELEQHGVVPTIVPAGQYFMKPLVTAVAAALGS